MSQRDAYASGGANWIPEYKNGVQQRYTTPLWEGVVEGCGSCKFARKNLSNPNGWHTQEVECVRYPPLVILGGGQPTQTRPRCMVRDWCGEYQRRDLDALPA